MVEKSEIDSCHGLGIVLSNLVLLLKPHLCLLLLAPAAGGTKGKHHRLRRPRELPVGVYRSQKHHHW